MSDPEEHIDFKNKEQQQIAIALKILSRAGYGIISPEYLDLLRAGQMSIATFGFKVPRPTTLIIKLLGLSPGEIRLFQDAERGWLVEAIERTGAQPVYKYVTDEIALTLLKGELTHELEAELMTPELEYIA